MTRPPYRYRVDGIEVLSDTPLALPACSGGGLGSVEFRSAAAADFLTATVTAEFDARSESWYRYAWLPDGSAYVQWESVGERAPWTRTRIQAAQGTAPLKSSRNALPARPGILYRLALGVQRCRLLPTSAMRAPEATPN